MRLFYADGIAADEASAVLQALAYVLMTVELYTEK